MARQEEPAVLPEREHYDARRRGESRLLSDVQHGVARILARSGDVAASSAELLQLLGNTLGWELGEVWLAGPQGLLTRSAWWVAAGVPGESFAAIRGTPEYAYGEDVLSALWMSHGTFDGSPAAPGPFDREVLTRAASAAGLTTDGSLSTMGFPIATGDRVIGAALLLSRDRKEAAFPALLQVLTEAGGQLGQLVARRWAEEALEKERLFLRELLDTLSEGIMACDAEGRVTLLNRAARALHAEGSDSKLDLHRADGRTPLAASEVPMARALNGELIEDLEVTVPGDGRARHLVTFGRPIVTESGQKLGAVVAYHDVTERRLLEQQLRQAQKMEALGRLAGGVAHDFNNLLTTVLGYAELHLADVPSTSPLSADLEEIRKAAHRGAGLTRQLLAFSRRLPMELSSVDVNALVKEMEGMLRRLIGEDIDLRTRLAPGLGRVTADAGQLEQVLLNLAVNARDAMPEGGRLVLETRSVALDEEGARHYLGLAPGDYVELAVSDTGHGIPAEILPRIFEPFFTTKAEGKGTGLGLSTAYGIVRQTGGLLSVYSEVARGTVFKAYLPVGQGTRKERQSAAALPVATGDGETILLVEDQSSLLRLAKAVLERAGYRVLAASGAATALAAVQRHGAPIQLLLTDVVLPELSGPRLAEQLRLRQPGLRTLFMSGYTDLTLLPDDVLSEEAHFLQKPFTPTTLLRRVRAAMS